MDLKNFDPDRRVSRREMIALGLKTGAGAVGVVSIANWLLGCSATNVAGATGAAASTGQAVLGSSSAWASGGTALMAKTYPNPFTTTSGDQTCTLYAEATEGPCYAPTLMRQDISEGITGLPVRLALRVVDAATCEPVSGATVDVWHTSAAGVYSAMAAGSFCNPTSEDLTKKHYSRGVQTTDADGRVDFNTIFPGWYQGRTVHIHFRVRIGDVAMVTSQLFFEDSLADELFASHVDYAARPTRGTTNKNDNILPRTGQDAFILSTARMTDGVLQAWKTIAIKTP